MLFSPPISHPLTLHVSLHARIRLFLFSFHFPRFLLALWPHHHCSRIFVAVDSRYRHSFRIIIFRFSFVFGCGKNIAFSRFRSFHFLSFHFFFFFCGSLATLHSIMRRYCCHTRAVCRWEMRYDTRYIEIVCAAVFISNDSHKYTHFIFSCRLLDLFARFRCAIVCVCEAMPFVRESDWYTWCVRGSKVIRKTNNSSLDLSVIDHCVSMWICVWFAAPLRAPNQTQRPHPRSMCVTFKSQIADKDEINSQTRRHT